MANKCNGVFDHLPQTANPGSSVLTSYIAAPTASDGGYQVTRKIAIPGQGDWEYLTIDDAARRLYVSHGTRVEVRDVDSGAIVGKIPNTLGVRGIAIAPEQGRGFVSSGQSSTVTVFDLKTLKTILKIDSRKMTVEKRWPTAPCQSPSSMLRLVRPQRTKFPN